MYTIQPNPDRTLPVVIDAREVEGHRAHEHGRPPELPNTAATNRFLNCLGDPTVPDRYLRDAEDALRAEVGAANQQRLISGFEADINELVQHLDHGLPMAVDDRIAQQGLLDQLVADRDYLTDHPPALPPSRFDEPATLRGRIVSYLARLDRGVPYQTMQVDPGCVLASKWDPATLAPEFDSPEPDLRDSITSTLAGDLPEVLDFSVSIHRDDVDQLYDDLDAVTSTVANRIERESDGHHGVLACLTRAAEARRLGGNLGLAIRYVQLGHETNTAAAVTRRDRSPGRHRSAQLRFKPTQLIREEALKAAATRYGSRDHDGHGR